MNDHNSSYSHSYLFTVRLWSEDMGSAGCELRGEVHHVLGGEMRYFREWSTLVSYLAARMQELESQKGGEGTAYEMAESEIEQG